jgi:DNA replication and repair protein RecF
VTLRHFRNLGVQEVEVPPQGAALVGANAQGKSNFLEAVYYLETFRSFRGARDGQLLAFEEDVFRISARLEGDEDEEPGREREVTAAYQRSGRRKKVTVDGVEPPRLGDAIGTLAAVIFSPSDVAMVSEGPDERRRFLDIVLSLNRPGYLGALQAFRHVLAQRNATLKEDAALALVRVWDEGLVEAGARVMEARRAWIERWTDTFARIYGMVSGGRDARLDYRPNVTLDGAEGAEAVAEAYRTALRDSAETERRMRTTMVGPQRDEMVITLEGERELDVRDYGSGGQRRTAALALRLVEAATIREARGREPLLLLDDVFAELDPGRSERILELMEREETGQVILTAPRDADVRLRGGSLPRWSIEDGVISA